jgi:multidrug efflux system membrane fusion protein
MAIVAARAGRFPWTFLVLGTALALAGCGASPGPAESPQPVLVTRPATDSSAQAGAYAGDIHAREESALAFRVGGNLIRRMVVVGDRVHRGQVLAELDPADLRLQAQASRAQLAAAQAELTRASADRQRYARLAQQQLVSRSALDAQDAAVAAAAGQVRAIQAQGDVARNAAGYTRLLAPRDGVIAERLAEAGQVVAPGQAFFTLAADSGREVAIALPESDIVRFHVGQPALVELWNAPGRRLPGTIRTISPAADPQARTFAARVSLAGAAADAVELGQSARVYLSRADDTRLPITLSALQRGGHGGSAVWVLDPRTRTLHLAPVRIGALGSDTVPVLSGVTATQWIVSAGGHLLREGEHVAPVDKDNRPVAADVDARVPTRPGN